VIPLPTPGRDPLLSATLSREELWKAISAGAQDASRAESAAAYVIRTALHGKWIQDGYFVEAAVRFDADSRPGSPIKAYVDWPQAVFVAQHSPASGGELRMLRLACSLAGHLPSSGDDAEEWSLGAILEGLDDENLRVAKTAMALAIHRPGYV
jgi:hypothetical protein